MLSLSWLLVLCVGMGRTAPILPDLASHLADNGLMLRQLNRLHSSLADTMDARQAFDPAMRPARKQFLRLVGKDMDSETTFNHITSNIAATQHVSPTHDLAAARALKDSENARRHSFEALLDLHKQVRGKTTTDGANIDLVAWQYHRATALHRLQIAHTLSGQHPTSTPLNTQPSPLDAAYEGHRLSSARHSFISGLEGERTPLLGTPVAGRKSNAMSPLHSGAASPSPVVPLHSPAKGPQLPATVHPPSSPVLAAPLRRTNSARFSGEPEVKAVADGRRLEKQAEWRRLGPSPSARYERDAQPLPAAPTRPWFETQIPNWDRLNASPPKPGPDPRGPRKAEAVIHQLYREVHKSNVQAARHEAILDRVPIKERWRRAVAGVKGCVSCSRHLGDQSAGH